MKGITLVIFVVTIIALIITVAALAVTGFMLIREAWADILRDWDKRDR